MFTLVHTDEYNTSQSRGLYDWLVCCQSLRFLSGYNNAKKLLEYSQIRALTHVFSKQ